MKKTILSLICSLLASCSFSGAFASCYYNGNTSTIQQDLQGCAPTGSITSSDYYITWGVKGKVVRITNQLIVAGSILSVWGIVFAAILYVISAWDGEKVKKAKTALKFSVIGFIVMLLSFPMVNAIVNLIYGLG